MSYWHRIGYDDMLALLREIAGTTSSDEISEVVERWREEGE